MKSLASWEKKKVKGRLESSTDEGCSTNCFDFFTFHQPWQEEHRSRFIFDVGIDKEIFAPFSCPPDTDASNLLFTLHLLSFEHC